MIRGHIRKRVYKHGTTWQIVIELGNDEKGKRKRIFKSMNGTKRDAEIEMQKMLGELNDGIFVNETKMTVSSYLENWLKTYVEPNLSPNSIDSYRTNIEKHIVPYVGNIQLQKLSPMHLQDMYLKLSKNGRSDGKGGLSPRSIRYIHRNLSKALDYAMKMQLVKRNVATLVTIPKVKPYVSQIYDEDEIIRLLDVAKGTDMEVPVTLASTLGLRRGEVLGLKWSDIDMKEYRMTIRNNLISTSAGIQLSSPKTDTSCRSLELSDGIVTILRRHKISQKENKMKLGGVYNDNGLVCCYPDGRAIDPKNFSKRFSNFLRRNGLRHIRFHDLRHSNATLMLSYGIPAKIASKRLGHSSIDITMDLYSHVTTNMQKDVASKIEKGIFNKLASNS